MRCPNKSLPEYKNLVKELGNDQAFEAWYRNGEEIPLSIEHAKIILGQSPIIPLGRIVGMPTDTSVTINFNSTYEEIGDKQESFIIFQNKVLSNVKLGNEVYPILEDNNVLDALKEWVNEKTNGQSNETSITNLQQSIDNFNPTIPIISENTEPINQLSEEDVNSEVDKKLISILKSLGFDVQSVNELEYSAVAKTDLVRRLVEVVKGRTDKTTLPEEVAHIVVALLGKNHPLYKMAIDKIEQTQTYQDVVKEYGEIYGNNTTKLKEEAVGKLVATEILKLYESKEKQGTKGFIERWWNEAMKYLAKLFKNTDSTEFSDILKPYTAIASKIINEEFNDLQNIEDADDFGEMYQISNTDYANAKHKLDNINKTIRPLETEHGYEVNVNGTWKRVKSSVTDLVQAFKIKTGREYKGDNTDNRAAWFGTLGHKITQGILKKMAENLDQSKAMNDDNYDYDGLISIAERKDIVDQVIKELRNTPEYSKYDIEEYKFLESHIGTSNLKSSAITTLKDIVNNQKRINKRTGKPDGKFVLYTELPIYNEVENRAGSIDLVVLYSNGLTGIRDWKFQRTISKNWKDNVFKDAEYSIQLGRYKEYLMKTLGLKEFAETRIIQLQMNYDANKPGFFDKDWNTKRSIPEKTVAKEYTNTALDITLEKVYNKKQTLEKQLMEAKGESEQNKIIAKLIQLNTVIDDTVLNRNVSSISSLLVSLSNYFNNKALEPSIKDGIINPKSINYQDLNEAYDTLDVFSTFVEEMNQVYLKNYNGIDVNDEEDVKNKSEILRINNSMSAIKLQLDQKTVELLNRDFNGDILRPNNDMSYMASNFTKLSEFKGPAFEKLSQIVRTIDFKWNEDYISKRKEFREILDSVKKTGLSLSEAAKLLNDKETGHLISEFKKNIHKDTVEHIKNNNVNWLTENTDLEFKDGVLKYSKEGQAKYEKDLANFEEYKKKTYGKFAKDPTEHPKYKSDIAAYEKDRSLGGKFQYNYYTIKNTDITTNPAYKSLSKELKHLRKYMMDFNRWTHSIAPHATDNNPLFIAEVLNDTFENIMKNGMSNFGSFMASAFKPRMNDDVSGMLDSNGKVINAIPFPFTDAILDDNITKEEEGKLLADIKNDKANSKKSDIEIEALHKKAINALKREKGLKLKSQDIFKSFELYMGAAIGYKYTSEYEDAAIAVKNYINTSSKVRSIASDASGKSVRDKFTDKVATYLSMDKEALENYDKFMNYYFYGQKIQSGDMVFGRTYDENGEVENRGISGAKLIKANQQLAAISALGLNLRPAIGTLIGSSVNTIFEAGNKTSITKQSLWDSMKYIKSNMVTQVGLSEYFGLDDRLPQKKARQLSSNLLDKHATADKMFSLMHGPDMMVQNTILTAMLHNYGYNTELKRIDLLHRLPEGSKKLIDYVKQTHPEESKKNVISFPEIDQDELIRFKLMFTKNRDKIMGSMTNEDIRLYQTNLVMGMLMQFKNWMPGLVSNRFGKLEFDKAFQDFEQGRFIVAWNEIMGSEKGMLKKMKNFVHFAGVNVLLNTLPFMKNDKGFASEEILKIEFTRYWKENGDEFTNLNFDEAFERFKEMRVEKLNAFAREVRIMLMFLSMLALIGGAGWEDDEEEKKKLKQSLLYKMTNRGLLEMTFFFNPFDTLRILEKPIGALPNIKKVINFLGNTVDQTSDDLFGQNDLSKLGKPIDATERYHYFKQMFPGLNNLSFYDPFDDGKSLEK